MMQHKHTDLIFMGNDVTCKRCGKTWGHGDDQPSCDETVTLRLDGKEAIETLIGKEFDKLANFGVDVNLWAAERGCIIHEDGKIIETPEALRGKILASLLLANSDEHAHGFTIGETPQQEYVGNAQTPVFATEEQARDVARATLVPDTNPKTRMGALKIPLHLVPPSATHALAIAFEDGARKYGAFNFRDSAVSSSTYYAALLRHVSAWFDGEDVAEDSGIEHLHHAMACLAILIDAKSVGKLNDDRPTAGASAKLQAEYLGDRK